MDCVHAASTVFFLLVLAEPMLEKLDRIKIKYGPVSYTHLDVYKRQVYTSRSTIRQLRWTAS